MCRINTQAVEGAMKLCCEDFDNVCVTCVQDGGVVLQWEYSNKGGPTYHTMESLTASEVKRMSSYALNSSLLSLVSMAHRRISGFACN